MEENKGGELCYRTMDSSHNIMGEKKARHEDDFIFNGVLKLEEIIKSWLLR